MDTSDVSGDIFLMCGEKYGAKNRYKGYLLSKIKDTCFERIDVVKNRSREVSPHSIAMV